MFVYEISSRIERNGSEERRERTDTIEGALVVAELEELEDVRAGVGGADLALGLEDGEAGEGEVEEGL